MKDTRVSEIRVGIAVIVSLLILVLGIMWGKGISLSVSRRPISVEFKNVGGLEPGSNVLANGVVMGRVSDVVLRNGKIFVEATLDNEVKLYSDYVIMIESPTLMAGKVLSIYPGDSLPVIATDGPLRGSEPLGVGEAVKQFQDLAGELKVTLGHVTETLVSLNEIIGDTSNQAHYRSLLANADEVAGNTATLLRENRAKLSQALDELTLTISSARALTESTQSRLGPTFDAVDSAATRLGALTTSLRIVVDHMNSDTTTVGRLLRDDEIYIRLNRTLASVDSLAVSIRTKGLRNKIVLF